MEKRKKKKPLESGLEIPRAYLFARGGTAKYETYTAFAGGKRARMLIFTVFILTLILTVVTVPIFQRVGNYAFRFVWGITPPIIIIGYTLFLLFKSATIPRNALIDVLSTATLGIYLIHNGALLPVIYDVFDISAESYFEQGWWFRISVAIFAVTIIGCVVDVLRSSLEKWILPRIMPAMIAMNTFLLRNIYTGEIDAE